MLTSERLWGDHATVPSLAVYEALRAPGERGIAQYRYTLGRARLGRRGMTLPSWLTDPLLEPVWQRLRAPLERGARTTRLTALDRSTRHALSGVLGRPVTGDVTLVLADVDALLQERARIALVAMIEAATGPLRDRAAEREARLAPVELLAGVDVGWAERVRTSGILTRVDEPVALVEQAIAVLGQLPGETGCGPSSRLRSPATHTPWTTPGRWRP